MDNHICPGCKVNGDWGHKCHNNQNGYCDCPDCIGADNFPRKCTCEECRKDETMAKFLMIFSEKEQEQIYLFLKFRKEMVNNAR